MVPYYASCGAYKCCLMRHHSMRQHCHVAAKDILVANNIKESFLIFLSDKDLYATNQ